MDERYRQAAEALLEASIAVIVRHGSERSSEMRELDRRRMVFQRLVAPPDGDMHATPPLPPPPVPRWPHIG